MSHKNIVLSKRIYNMLISLRADVSYFFLRPVFRRRKKYETSARRLHVNLTCAFYFFFPRPNVSWKVTKNTHLHCEPNISVQYTFAFSDDAWRGFLLLTENASSPANKKYVFAEVYFYPVVVLDQIQEVLRS